MTILISFLGRSQLDSKGGYREASYRLPDGAVRSARYFGLALAQHLAAERVLLLGTATSMWDLLVENVAGDTASEDARIELFDAVRQGTTSNALLDRLTPAMTQVVGCPVQALLIPPAVDFAEQQTILTRLRDAIPRKSRVALDLTHGFRHLAMLGLAAARFLSHEREVQIVGLYYGALDMTSGGTTPVLGLDGLDHLQQWSETFEAYAASGDFARFAPLLERDGFAAEHARALQNAWSYLMVSNVADAARALTSAVHALEQPLQGASELFRKRLRNSLDWALAPTLSEKFRRLALQALNRRDFTRASIFGMEAFLSREVERNGGNPNDYAARENARNAFWEQARNSVHPDWRLRAFFLLNNVRNACAHGTPSKHDPSAELLRNPERLAQELERVLNQLTNTP
jgi:CRISPR-associated Csx2 family protein